MFIWDELWNRSSAWILSKNLGNWARTHGDIEVFPCIFTFLLILRTLNTQCSGKEPSCQDVCMGWIVDRIGRLNFVKKIWESDMNSWSYGGFPMHFRFFADFKDFNHPTLWEGAVMQRSFYGINCKADRALEFRQKYWKSDMNSWRYWCFSFHFQWTWQIARRFSL